MNVLVRLLLVLLTQVTYVLGSPNLNDLPSPTVENLRWNIDPNEWQKRDEFLAKGKYFKIYSSLQEVDKKGGKLNIYSNSKLNDPILLSVRQGSVLDSSGSTICELHAPAPEKTKNYYSCSNGGCVKVSETDLVDIYPYEDLNLELKKTENEICPHKVDMIYASDSEGSYFLFKYDKISEDKKSVQVNISGQSTFLDIRKCLMNTSVPSSKCSTIDLEQSVYEKNWLKLKQIQQSRSHKPLNNAIRLLTPCVVAKDLKCVGKYMSRFVTEEENFEETPLTPEIFKELEKCLDYKNLLPHLKASRGIEKACIFNSSSEVPLRGVTFIEALSTNGKTVNTDK